MQAHGHVLGALGGSADGITAAQNGAADSAPTTLAAAEVSDPNAAAAAANESPQGAGGLENEDQGTGDVRNGPHSLSNPRHDAGLVRHQMQHSSPENACFCTSPSFHKVLPVVMLPIWCTLNIWLAVPYSQSFQESNVGCGEANYSLKCV